jgi:hypothetical protein
MPCHLELVDELIELRRVIARSHPKSMRRRSVSLGSRRLLPAPQTLAQQPIDDLFQGLTFTTSQVLDLGRQVLFDRQGRSHHCIVSSRWNGVKDINIRSAIDWTRLQSRAPGPGTPSLL